MMLYFTNFVIFLRKTTSLDDRIFTSMSWKIAIERWFVYKFQTEHQPRRPEARQLSFVCGGWVRRMMKIMIEVGKGWTLGNDHFESFRSRAITQLGNNQVSSQWLLLIELGTDMDDIEIPSVVEYVCIMIVGCSLVWDTRTVKLP